MSDVVALSLWSEDGVAPVGAFPALGSSAYGKLAELQAIGELLRRGHKVAVPVVDDDGVDLVVDYRVTVQVKSSYRRLMRTAPGFEYEAFTWGSGRVAKFTADVFLLHGDDRGRSRWWVVPVAVFGSRRSGQINLYLSSSRGLSAVLREYEDRWDLFS